MTGHPTRRGLLTAGGGTVLAGIAAVAVAKPDNLSGMPPAQRDAKLIALCDRIILMRAENDALARAIPSGLPSAEIMRMEDEQILPLDERRWDLIEEAEAITAHTMDGHRARARMLLDNGDVTERGHVGVWALVRDLLREAV